jgi:hypothetical protein
MRPLTVAANAAWLAASLPAWRRFTRALPKPEEAQDELLRFLLARHADCAFGRAHGFGETQSYAEFARRVPLSRYHEAEEWIVRIRAGEARVLTADPVGHLVPTSGSTGARKLIPFTAGLQRAFNAAVGAWMVDLARQHPAIVGGPAYWSISPVANGKVAEASAVPIGFDDDSAYLGGARQKLVAATMAVPPAVRGAADMESFRSLTLLCLLRRRDLRLVSMWHPSFLTLLFEAMPAAWDALVEDIRRGACRWEPALRGRPQPGRARELAALGPDAPAKLWPALRVISCWGDVMAEPGCAELRRRFPGVTVQAKGLLATEACVTVPFRGHRPLAVTSHFFEFLGGDGGLRRAHELQPGVSYEVVVTNGGGLWRYRMGDLVEVDGFVGATPSLRFLGRVGNVSDLRGEKLSEVFVATVLNRMGAGAGGKWRFALLAPETDAEARASYTLFVEGSVADNTATCLDVALRENPQYALCRDLGQLDGPRVFRISGGGQDVFTRVELASGRCLGEVKPQSLSRRDGWASRFAGSYHR